MTPLEDRLRAAAPDAFPPTPAINWAASITPHVNRTAQTWRRRRVLVALLAALLVPAVALAVPGIRRALGIGAHIRVVVTKTLPPSGGAAPHVTRTRGRYLVKYVTPDTRVTRLGPHAVFLEGGRHVVVIIRPDGTGAPPRTDTGNTLVYERHGTVTRIDGVPSLSAARALLRSRAP